MLTPEAAAAAAAAAPMALYPTGGPAALIAALAASMLGTVTR